MTLEQKAESEAMGGMGSEETGGGPAKVVEEPRLTQLLLSIALAANEAGSGRRALERALELVCSHTDWEAGHAYQIDERGALASTGIWCLPDPSQRQTLHKAAEASRLGPGGGLPGVVRQTGRPMWVEDVTKDPRSIRRMAEIGLRAALAVPVLSGAEVVAVLEFFAADPARPDPALLEVMAGVGAQLGRVIERERAERALRSSEERLSTIIRLAPGAVISMDASRSIQLFNRSAEEIFGFTAREMIGRPLELLLPSHAASLEWTEPPPKGDSTATGAWAARQPATGKRKNGQSFPAEVSTAMVRTNGEHILTLVLTDVSERVEAERRRDHAVSLLRATLESTADGILAMNERGKLEGFNQRFLDLWQIPAEASEGLSETAFYTVMMERVKEFDAFRARLTEVMGHPDVESEEVIELMDGRLLEARSIPQRVEGRSVGRVWSFRDVTERRRAEERVQQQLDRLATLRTIDLAIAGSLDLRITLKVILDQVVTSLRVDAADILLLSPVTQQLEYAEGRGFRATVAPRVVRLGEGYAGQVALDRNAVEIPDLAASLADPRIRTLPAGEGFHAYFALPLISKGQVKGVLEIFNRAPLAPEPDWIGFLEALAGQAAIAVENSLFFADLQRSNLELMLAYDTTLEGWAHALDLRDRETEGHSRRVTDLTLRLARAVGINEVDLVHIRRGALLHDIGKMAIPDDILLKEGELNEEEWRVMREHPMHAFNLLSSIEFLRPALEIPLNHHEHWDGSGYPSGMKGEAIPLAARVFAVVDVWDALRSDRPYREAISAEEAREEIRSLAGTHLDPRIVDAFLRMEIGEA